MDIEQIKKEYQARVDKNHYEYHMRLLRELRKELETLRKKEQNEKHWI